MLEDIQKTQDEIITEQVLAFTSYSKATRDGVAQNIKVAFDLIWNNPLATPQEMLAKLGTKAGAYFLASKEIQDYLVKWIPDYQRLVPPNEFTLNEDGTVTVGDLIVNPEE